MELWYPQLHKQCGLCSPILGLGKCFSWHTNSCQWWVQNTALNNRTFFKISRTVSWIGTETKSICRYVFPFANQQISKHLWTEELEKIQKSEDDSPMSLNPFFKLKSSTQMPPKSHQRCSQPRVTHILHFTHLHLAYHVSHSTQAPAQVSLKHTDSFERPQNTSSVPKISWPHFQHAKESHKNWPEEVAKIISPSHQSHTQPTSKHPQYFSCSKWDSSCLIHLEEILSSWQMFSSAKDK